MEPNLSKTPNTALPPDPESQFTGAYSELASTFNCNVEDLKETIKSRINNGNIQDQEMDIRTITTTLKKYAYKALRARVGVLKLALANRWYSVYE